MFCRNFRNVQNIHSHLISRSVDGTKFKPNRSVNCFHKWTDPATGTIHIGRHTAGTSHQNSSPAAREVATSASRFQDSVSPSSAAASSVSRVTASPVGFAKNLCLGKFNKDDAFPFPEITVEQFEHLNQMCDPIEKYFNEEVDSKTIDVNAKIDEKTLQGLKDLGLFGQQVPEDYGGLGLSNTEFARLAEITAQDGSIAVTLAAHQSIGFKGLLIAGTEEQKAKYLPKLATGANIKLNLSGSDAASIRTKATLSPDGKHYLLNGGKIWISNGGIADVFTVFARTDIVDEQGNTQEKITAFFVERNFGGITNGKPEDKLGIRGSNTCEVHFDNTPVPLENIIGEVGGGFKIAMNILNSGRFSMGSSGAGMLKKLIGMAADHASQRKQFDTKLKEFGMIQEKIGRMTMTAYVMESMAYLTAGILDRPGKPDCSVEAAMVKIFSSEGGWTCVSEALQILGGLGYMKDYPYERFLRDCRILLIFEGTNEILRLYVALTCMQHAGKELGAMVKKLQNPVANPGFAFKMLGGRMLGRLGLKSSTVKLQHDDGGVHPSLQASGKQLAHCVSAFQGVVEGILSKYKKEIVKEQMILKRVADILIDLYGMTAVLSRASRAKTIGLRNCDHDILIATTFVNEAAQRVGQNMHEIGLAPNLNNDASIMRIADEVFENHGYKASHPLTREF
nr:complex I assembly factor ACAD9, mitochondrial-like [Lytechinus pictus]